MDESEATGGFCSYKDDPIAQLGLVDKYVRVELLKKCSYEGFVHSFDPVTNSLGFIQGWFHCARKKSKQQNIILSSPQDGNFKTTVIPGHAILGVAECKIPTNITPPCRKSYNSDPKAAMQRKLKLMEWLKSNLLPVTELDDKIVFGNLCILPPYTAMDVCTENSMVAMQMKKLIENMPEDDTMELEK